MNERIYEFATRAGAYCETYLHGGDPKPPILDNMDLEKFAQLIVKECVHICAKENWKTLGEDMKGLRQFDRGIISGRKIMSKELCDKIEQHFGVE